MAYKRLGDILTDAGLVSEEQIDRAVELGRKKGLRLGESLIENNIITELQLIEVLKLQLGVEFIDLTTVSIPTAMASLVPKNLARKHMAVPVRAQGDTIYLAMVDPLNFVAIEEIRTASRKKIIPMIATRSATDRAISALYGNEGVSRAIDDLQKTMGVDSGSDSALLINAADEDENSAPAIRLVNSILERGVSEGASDIHMEPHRGGMLIRMRIDGVLHTMLTVPQNLQSSLISRVKIIGDMDISEKRVPQDGRATVRVKQQSVDMRISTLPTTYGEKIVIRFLEKSESLLSTEGIGLKGDYLTQYNNMIRNSNGVILIAGPTGSGKSTTMYTMVRNLYSEETNLITLEDPVEYDMDGINQVQINEKVGLTFAAGLRSILRQDPDVIAVGEIRDGETAEIAMRAAITGHLVLSTIHTNSAIATLDRLEDIGVEPYLIASALKGVISQRLVRKICPNCKKPYTPTEEELAEMEITPEEAAGMRFAKGTGCGECMDTGYRGRAAVFEMLVLNNEIKTKFRENAPHSELVEAVYRSSFHPMRDHALMLVGEGTTTISEAMRVLHSTDG